MKPIWGRQTVLETGSREELQKAERLLADHGLWCSSWDAQAAKDALGQNAPVGLGGRRAGKAG